MSATEELTLQTLNPRDRESRQTRFDYLPQAQISTLAKKLLQMGISIHQSRGEENCEHFTFEVDAEMRDT